MKKLLALLLALALLPALSAAESYDEEADPYIEEIITWRELAITAACVFVFGFVIMVFCTLLSVNKYLRMKARELYKI